MVGLEGFFQEMWRCGSMLREITLQKTNGWNLKITILKSKIIFQACIFEFHVSFLECKEFFFFLGPLDIFHIVEGLCL